MDPRLKTALYLGVLTAMLILLGDTLFGYEGVIVMLLFSTILNFILYFYSDKIILSYYPVYPCTDQRIIEIVREVSKKAGIPEPKVFIMKSPYPNAFATGRNPKNSVVVLTEGLLEMLNEDEIEAIVGHEISHIKNYDTLISTISAVIAGVIGTIARILFWTEEDKERGILALIFIPLLALLIRLAISRQREYLADEDSCRITGKPFALISALEKISGKKYYINPGHAHMFIHNPLPSIFEIFSTHPPVEKRIERIRELFG